MVARPVLGPVEASGLLSSSGGSRRRLMQRKRPDL